MVIHMTHQDCRGFSLIEVLIAMAVFTIGILGLYAMQVNSAKGNTKANQQTGAVTAASQAVEQLMRTPYIDKALVSTPADGTQPHDWKRDPTLLPNLKIGQAPYIDSITWDVSDLGEVSPETKGVKQVKLTVTDQNGRKVNITFLRIKMI
jgi:prepilin-type N-terminal cleavage/methylation domain-containing protein